LIDAFLERELLHQVYTLDGFGATAIENFAHAGGDLPCEEVGIHDDIYKKLIPE